MRAETTAQLVSVSLVIAARWRCKLNALLHHSDQGNQYATE